MSQNEPRIWSDWFQSQNQTAFPGWFSAIYTLKSTSKRQEKKESTFGGQKKMENITSCFWGVFFILGQKSFLLAAFWQKKGMIAHSPVSTATEGEIEQRMDNQ